MANTDVQYSVTVKDVRRKVLPALDDEFAKDLGAFGRLALCATGCAATFSRNPTSTPADICGPTC